jgi:hypothetical protein
MSHVSKRFAFSLIFLSVLLLPMFSAPIGMSNSPATSTAMTIAQTDQYQVYYGGTVDSVRFVEYNSVSTALIFLCS